MPVHTVVNAHEVFPDYIVRQLQQRLKGKGTLVYIPAVPESTEAPYNLRMAAYFTAQGWSASRIATRLKISARQVQRLRREAREHPERLAPKPPPTLAVYQERGYSWLSFLRRWRLGACLANNMGLGKTVQTLALLQRDREEGVARPVLLICPTSVVNNWRKERQTMSHRAGPSRTIIGTSTPSAGGFSRFLAYIHAIEALDYPFTIT